MRVAHGGNRLVVRSSLRPTTMTISFVMACGVLIACIVVVAIRRFKLAVMIMASTSSVSKLLHHQCLNSYPNSTLKVHSFKTKPARPEALLGRIHQ